jgi:hypothetical protein
MKREMLLVDDLIVDQTKADLDDLRSVADHCKSLQSAGLTKLSQLPGELEVRHLATIPAFMVEKWINDNGVTFHEFMGDPKLQTRMLNDPGLAYFRVSPGRV